MIKAVYVTRVKVIRVKNGFTYPHDQTSTAVLYFSWPSKSSGGRYHRVITLLV